MKAKEEKADFSDSKSLESRKYDENFRVRIKCECTKYIENVNLTDKYRLVSHSLEEFTLIPLRK